MRTIIASVLISGLVLLLGGSAVIYYGLYDVAATDPHWPATRWILETARVRSIKAHAASIKAPPGLDDPAVLPMGVEHFAAHCAVCHGAPGVSQGDIGRGLYPPPTDLAKAAPVYSTAELFWIVKHGIKMTGMPSWSDHTDEELWATVAFLKKLPGMSEQEYARLVMANMAHGAQHHHGGSEEGRPDSTAPASHEHHCHKSRPENGLPPACLIAGNAPQVLDQHEQMKRIRRRGREPEMLIEGARRVVFRVNGKSPDTGDVGGLQCATHRVFHETGADPPALPFYAHRQTRQQHDRHRMTRETFGQALGRILVGNLADHECVEADNGLIRKTEIGLRRAGLLVGEGEADQKAAELLASTIECIDRMIAAQLLNPQTRHHPGSWVSNTLRSRNSRCSRGSSRGGASSAAMKAAH